MTDARYPPLNPYVGARAFQRGEHLYGRDQEVMDLLSQCSPVHLFLIP